MGYAATYSGCYSQKVVIALRAAASKVSTRPYSTTSISRDCHPRIGCWGTVIVARHRGTLTSITHDPYIGVGTDSEIYEVYPTRFSETLPNVDGVSISLSIPINPLNICHLNQKDSNVR
jgi:hypothetical protein